MISIKNVTVKFDKKIILNNLSYDFKEGKISAIIGKSGAGLL